MNYFKVLSVLWTTKGIVQEEIKEAEKMDPVTAKPGWKTTEFWLNLAGQAIILWGAVKGFVPPQYAAIITIGGTAIYTIARTISKAVTDVQATKAASSTVTTTAPTTTVTIPA